MKIEDLKNWAKLKKVDHIKDILLPYAIVALWSIISSQIVDAIDNVAISFVLNIIGNFITFILTIGTTIYMVNFIKDKEFKIEMVWSRFKDAKDLIVTYLYYVGFVTLYMLLLIIPGIIKIFSYMLIPYIIADENNTLKGKELLDKSEEIMKGHKMELFKIYLSFLGWHLLACLTFGILEIWILPQQQLMVTKFLSDLKDVAYGITPQPLEEPAPAAPANTVKFCTNCGTQVSGETLYCPNCGAKIDLD